jgi:16S rRNA (guanine1207-N2)-methyltransferase
MDLHASCSTLEPGDSLFLYGARDEGIESALGGQELFQDVETVGVGGRCRVLAAARAPDPTGLKARLADWKCSFAPEVPGLPNAWVSYPGVFAHGRTDPGTRLLLNALPDLARGSRVLDYGCGSGMVGYVVHSRGEGVDVDLLDVDSVALAAARENVSDGRLLLRDGLPVETKKPYDAILSNPPFHVGKGEDPGLIVRLAEEAPRVLSRRGILVFVAQRRLSLGRSLEENFGKVTILAEDATYRVWEARKPAKR